MGVGRAGARGLNFARNRNGGAAAAFYETRE